jgi:hypothetical protein
MERLAIALCIVSLALIVSLCFLGYYYSEHVADKSMILMYEAQIKADKAADILAAQLAADALAAQMLESTNQQTEQAKQAAKNQAAALLEQKNNLTQQAAHDLEAAILAQKDISAEALSKALAAAQITADKAQQDAVAAQKSADATLMITAATIAVVQQSQVTTLAAVNSINTLIIQALTAYRTASLLVSNYAWIVGLARSEYINLPLNTPYEILAQHINKSGVNSVGLNYVTFPTATFLLNELNANYIAQLSAHHNTAASQNTIASAATTAEAATQASQAAQAAQVAATALTTTSVASFNSIITIVQNVANAALGMNFMNTNISSNTKDQESATALMQTVGFSPVMSAINNIVANIGTLMAYGEKIVNITPANVPAYIIALAKNPVGPPPKVYALVNGAWVASYREIYNSAPGIKSDRSISSVAAATNGAQRTMNTVYADIQNLTAAIITVCNMINAYIVDDMEILSGILHGSMVYKFCRTNMQLMGTIPPYSLSLALSLAQDEPQPLTDLPADLNYVPQMANVYTEYGNSFIYSTGGMKNIPQVETALYHWLQSAHSSADDVQKKVDECRALAAKVTANTNSNVSIFQIVSSIQSSNPVEYLTSIPKSIQIYEANKFAMYSQLLSGGYML